MYAVFTGFIWLGIWMVRAYDYGVGDASAIGSLAISNVWFAAAWIDGNQLHG